MPRDESVRLAERTGTLEGPRSGNLECGNTLPLSQARTCPRAPNRSIWLLAVFIAVAHATMAILAVDTKSPTFDEPQHLTAGYSYWMKNDFRLDPENGNFPARFAALPLLISKPNFVPINDRGWQRGDEGRTGHQFFYEVGNDPERILHQSRVMMSIFGAALCLLTFRCAREFFGAFGGLLAETIAAFDPTMLAHSALVASDVAAAFFFTAATWSAWRLFQKISVVRLVVAGLSLSGLFLTKFSAPVILPVVGMMCLFRIFSRDGIVLRIGQWEKTLGEKWTKLCAIAGSGLLLAAIVYLAIWSSFSFRYAAWTDNTGDHQGTAWHWKYLLRDNDAFEKGVSFAHEHRLLPEAYLYGFAYVHKHTDDRPAFLDNQWSLVGFRSFFPRAILYKSPLPVLALLILGAFFLFVRWKKHGSSGDFWTIVRHDLIRFSPLALIPVVYLASAIPSHLNIGLRHILPVYPALFVACGGTVYWLIQNGRRFGLVVVGILFGWQIVESVIISPNYLAYFNELAGGPSHGYTHLVDSSLDWGQDLPALSEWLEENKVLIADQPVYLSYFGTADPRWYGIHAQMLPENQYTGEKTFEPLSGGIYCISVTNLQSVYALEIGPWCAAYENQYRAVLSQLEQYHETTARVQLVVNDKTIPEIRTIKEFERMRFARLCAYLRHREPLARLGYSICVFKLTDEDAKQAIYGPPAELKPAPGVTGY